MINQGLDPQGIVGVVKSLVDSGVIPDKAAQLLSSMINQGLDPQGIVGVITSQFIPLVQLFGGNANLAAETISYLIERTEVTNISILDNLLDFARQNSSSKEEFLNLVQRVIVLTSPTTAVFQEEELLGGAPKCQPCSTNEVYKPPKYSKKKSIRKKKRKTNKKSKKKIIKKSPKYSKRKSIKKKSFKKSSKRNTLKKSKRKNKK